jgi:hypothetical protein
MVARRSVCRRLMISGSAVLSLKGPTILTSDCRPSHPGAHFDSNSRELLKSRFPMEFLTETGVDLPHQALGTILALLVALLGGCAAADGLARSRGGVQGSQKASSPIAPACRSGNPLANVHHSFRLKLIKPCVAVHGTVTSVRRMRDGDFHVNLRLDPARTIY